MVIHLSCYQFQKRESWFVGLRKKCKAGLGFSSFLTIALQVTLRKRNYCVQVANERGFFFTLAIGLILVTLKYHSSWLQKQLPWDWNNRSVKLQSCQLPTQALWSNFQYAVVSYEENNADNTFLNTQCCRKQSLYCNIIYNKPTRCNSGSIVFIKNYKYALHVSDALCVHRQEHYKL